MLGSRSDRVEGLSHCLLAARICREEKGRAAFQLPLIHMALKCAYVQDFGPSTAFYYTLHEAQVCAFETKPLAPRNLDLCNLGLPLKTRGVRA